MRNLLALVMLALATATAAAGPGIGIAKDNTLKGTGASTSPLGVDGTYVQMRVSSSCTTGSAIRAIAADGTVTCESAGATYIPGLGISITGLTIAIDDSYTQRRVSASCAAGSSIRAIAVDGTVTCESHPSGTVTNVSTLAPLQGGPITTTGTVSLSLCADGEVLKMNVGGTAWVCAADADSGGTVTSISGGTGVNVTNPTTTPTISLTNSVWQARASGTCTSPNAISAISATGVVTCTTNAVDGTLTTGVVPVATGSHTIGDSIIATTATTVTISTAGSDTINLGNGSGDLVKVTGQLQGLGANPVQLTTTNGATIGDSSGDAFTVNATTTMNAALNATAGATVTGSALVVGASKFTVDAATGNTSTAGTLGVTGQLTASDKLHVVSSSVLDGDITMGTASTTIHVKSLDTSQRPTISSCGTSPSVIGNDESGRITVGTGGASSCTITWHTAYGANYGCVLQSHAGNSFTSLTYTTTALTMTKALNSGEVIDYICRDH